MSSIRYELSLIDRGQGIVSIQSLSFGVVGDVWLVTYLDGSRIVVKTSFDVPKDFFAVEADGLNVLRTTGYVRTVEVLADTERMLVLEALGPRDDGRAAWEAFAHDLAGLHRGKVHDRFGWQSDGYLGWLPQHNTWTEDGHAFFAEHRLLRYLSEPLTEQVLEPADRSAVEHLCDRLPEIVPEMPAVLTHGDLWSANMLGGRDGRLVLIDPAVSYTWAEVDLSMLWCDEFRPPESEHFFTCYQELSPSPPGWIERMPLLFLREVLSTLAHLGGPSDSIGYLRRTLAPFYPD
jgi:fructosamine-3-kinase